MIEVRLQVNNTLHATQISGIEIYEHPGPHLEPDRTASRLLVRRDCRTAGSELPANSADIQLDPSCPYPAMPGTPIQATVERMTVTTLLAHGNINVVTTNAEWSNVGIRRESFGGFLFVPLTSALVELPEADFAHIEKSISTGDVQTIQDVETIPAAAILYELFISRALSLNFDWIVVDA